MSGWWDATALASIATNAIKTAQKKIDKVLDIKEQEAAAAAAATDQSGDLSKVALQTEDTEGDISSDRGGNNSRPASRAVSPRSPFAIKLSSSSNSLQQIANQPSTSSDVKTTSSPHSSVLSSPRQQSNQLISHGVDEEVQDLTADSSSLLIPASSSPAVLSTQAQSSFGGSNGNSSFSNVAPSFSGHLSPPELAMKNMVSSSEDTLVQDNPGNDSASNSDDLKVGKQSDSPRSIDSPAPPSEAASSCMGSELVRVDFAPSVATSDIEIVSTPSSCIVEGYTTVPSVQQESSRHFRPLVLPGAHVVNSAENSPSQVHRVSQKPPQEAHDQTAAQLMKQLADVTRSIEKKDSRILELSEENTLLHSQLTEIRRQMEESRSQEAQFGADTVRLLKNEIKERDQIIAELREEGEKLSKQQGQGRALIRKYQTKEKESEAQIQAEMKKNEDLQAKLMLLERQLTTKLEGERQSSEMVQQLTQTVKRLEKETQDKQQQLIEAKQELEQLDKRVSSVGDMSKEKEIKLLERIDQLGDVVRELEERLLTSERQRKSEIAELEAKLEQANSSVEELRESSTSAARPVVKQLESLQQNYATASRNWNDTEKSMTTKISMLEQALLVAEQRARDAEISSSTNEKRRSELERSAEMLKLELTKIQANFVQLEADRDVWKRRVSNLETMCEQERARAAGYERRATESESRLSMSSNSNQRRCQELELQLTKLERDHQELSTRYEKLLEMYGEKAEEADELRTDVEELRQVFRTHFQNFNSPNTSINNTGQSASPNT